MIQPDPHPPTALAGLITLPIEGMTCASCVQRVEKSLEKVPGVHAANVNLATETAQIQVADGTPRATLEAAVERAGYQIGVGPEVSPGDSPRDEGLPDAREQARQGEMDDLRRKSIVSLVIGALMMIGMYLPISHETLMLLAPVQLIAATVVQFWAGGTFYTEPPCSSILKFSIAD